MLLQKFISHQWKQARRSPIWEKNLATNLIMGFFFFILFIEMVGLSILISYKWHEIIEKGQPISEFHKVIAWYLAGMFAVRFFMQKLPALEIRPYQHLPIKKSSLVHFILGRGAINFFTLISIVILIPFAVFQVNYYHNGTVALIWFIGMFSLDMALNYLVFYVKKQLVTNLKTVSVILFIIASIAAGDYFGWYSFSESLGMALDKMLVNNILYFIPILLLLAMYFINFRFLKAGMYLENLAPESTNSYLSSNRFGYLKKMGHIGELISLDMRLHIRNKRTRSILFMSPFFLLYGLIFYTNDTYSKDGGFMIFIGMFISGVLMYNYLQYAFAYEGSFFDYLRTSGLNFADYVRAKMRLGTALSVISFVLTIPYVFFGVDIFMINLACFLLNIGLVAPVILYFASYNKKSMVLTKGSAFNYQGVGATHFLVLLPVFVLPVLIYLPFKWFGNPEMGLIAIGTIGLISLAFRKAFIQLIVKNLQDRKYIMLDGFRDKS